jgi:hypothetical protein
VLAVPPHHTSQQCPLCGHISPCNRRTQSLFWCLSCYTANADDVSSIHILSRGIEVLRDEGQDKAQACAGWETTARIACAANGAVRPSQEELSGVSASLRSSVGISGLQAGEDVNSSPEMRSGVPFPVRFWSVRS